MSANDARLPDWRAFMISPPTDPLRVLDSRIRSVYIIRYATRPPRRRRSNIVNLKKAVAIYRTSSKKPQTARLRECNRAERDAAHPCASSNDWERAFGAPCCVAIFGMPGETSRTCDGIAPRNRQAGESRKHRQSR